MKTKLLCFLVLVIQLYRLHIEVFEDHQVDKLQLLATKNVDPDKFRTLHGQLLFIAQSSRLEMSYDNSNMSAIV